MPAIMEQVSRLSVFEKLNLMESILRSIDLSAVEIRSVNPRRTSRIGICRGMWKPSEWEEDRALDREIEADFEKSLEESL